MIPHPAWQAPYELGLAHLRAGCVNEALRAFDEADELSDQHARPLRSRIEVLGMVRGVEAACVGAEKAAELAREPVESSETRLFEVFSRLPFRHQSIILHPSTDDPSVDSMLASDQFPLQLVESRLISLKAQRNLIDYLPPEILTIIGRLVVEDMGSSDFAFTLAAVSRRWRAVFLEDLRIWGSVVLDHEHEQVMVSKLEAFLAKGPLLDLVLKYGSPGTGDLLMRAMSGRVPCIRSIVVRRPAIALYKIMALVKASPHCETIVVHLPSLVASLDLVPPSLAVTLTSVRRLEFRRQSLLLGDGSLPYPMADILTAFPNLEDLVLDHTGITMRCYPATFLITQPVNLPALRRLAICCSSARGPRWPFPPMTFPALRVMDLSACTYECYVPYLFPTNLPPNTVHLTHLLLRRSNVDVPTLIGHLSHLAALTHLDVRHSNASVALARAFTHPATGKDGLQLCPRLKQLDVEQQLTEDVVNLRHLVKRLCASRSETGITVMLWDGPV